LELWYIQLRGRGEKGEMKISLLQNMFIFGVGDISFHSGMLVGIFVLFKSHRDGVLRGGVGLKG